MATKPNNPTRPESLAGIDWIALAIFLSPIGIAVALGMAR